MTNGVKDVAHSNLAQGLHKEATSEKWPVPSPHVILKTSSSVHWSLHRDLVMQWHPIFWRMLRDCHRGNKPTEQHGCPALCGSWVLIYGSTMAT